MRDTAALDLNDGFVAQFTKLARLEPDRLFARFESAPVTFRWLHRASNAVALHVRQRSVRRGDRVAVMLRNSPLTLAVLYGLAKAGVAWVPVNVQLRGDGLRYILEHAEAALVIAEADVLSVVGDSGVRLGDGDLLSADAVEPWLNEDAVFDEGPPASGDVFAIMYTSGTTGPPKGVVVTHRMLGLAGQAVALVSAVRDGDVLFMWEPLFHIGGAQLLVLPLIRRVVLAMVRRFSASRFWSDVREQGATHIHFLGGILQILLKQLPGPLDRGHGARIAWGGGCPAEVWRPFQDRFGLEIRECYGMTEASSITTYNAFGLVGSVGRSVPWFRVELLDDHGHPLPPGGRGEIVVRSTLPGAITPGYFRNPGATERALRGGALHTGDLGSFDAAGNLIFYGRMTDSVRCRGENVSAWEVEHVAAAHPAVEDCAMIGVAAEIGEQDIKLFVQPTPGIKLDVVAFSQWLGERLAPYQNPRYIAVVDGFERTPSQRIMKHKLPSGRDGCWDRLGPSSPM